MTELIIGGCSRDSSGRRNANFKVCSKKNNFQPEGTRPCQGKSRRVEEIFVGCEKSQFDPHMFLY